jgi:CheY-like chemotaxis protein/DNA-directed RNA polymerase specialized sigma24 family protein
MNTARQQALIQALPYVRRYARALTGGQASGDLLVADSLREMLVDAATPQETTEDLRRTLYAWVTRRFDAGGRSLLTSPFEGLSNKQRQLLLLTALEELSLEDTASIVSLDLPEAAAQLADARERLRTATAADVLIIEDEPIIAMDLEDLVESCGHRVVGTAGTEAEAVEIAARTPPGLILADINLGEGGDGASAVSRILRRQPAPVIFVTAYPERLLTGAAPEPAFVITKPFEPLTLAIATYQAVTAASG